MSKNPFLPPWGLLLKTLVEQSAEYDAEQRDHTLVRDSHGVIIGSKPNYHGYQNRPGYVRRSYPRSALRRTGAPSKSYQRSGGSRRYRSRRRRRKGFYWSYKHKRWMKSKF